MKAKIWYLTDRNGSLVIAGAKGKVMKVFNGRYVYEGIHTDNLYKTVIDLSAETLERFHRDFNR